MNALPPNEGRSWWLREALARPEFAGEPCPPLDTDTKADVVILGGGYTGMWTAWFLKELDPGLDIVLLEQDICGGGPSGRNGGFVNSFWDALDFLAERFGDAPALRICRAGQESVDGIGRFCEEHDIDAWFAAEGTLSVASSTAQIGAWADLIMAVDRMGLSDIITVLSRDEVRTMVDSPVFHAGVLTKVGGTVQPARLARGLRRVLLERGVRIHEGTHVSRFGAGDPVVADTAGGTVRANAAVLAVNAWAQHWRRFKRVITVRGSYIVLTAPAPDRLAAINWTSGLAVSDQRSAVHYLRTTPDGRIAFGIGGMQPDLARDIDPRFAYDEGSIRVAVDDLYRMFPAFADVPIEAGWGGPIDVSGDHLPFFGTLETGNVHYGLGFTGNGVGPAHLGGRILAHRALAKYDDVLALPLVDLEPRRFPPEPIRSVGAMVTNRAIHRRDVTLDGEETPNPFVDFVAKLPRRLGYNLGP
ncbi:MAG: FAD-dependent oxidoreductase [Actinobacteria bacterium]|nr:MAG: FAD-dependent oxidoreductase [Actinomycetota bacterium]TMK20194.1 MAG: FAD-dependent oxidoreductase [Actinomycetota bacterium]TMK94701.1 MAG: FAD-dependent oxidoreductase [Actinomycetota bacterium]